MIIETTELIDAETIPGEPKYLPSPEDIGRVCAEIQAEWSESERERRHVGMRPVMVDENRRHRVNCGD